MAHPAELLDGGVWRIPLTLPFGPPTANVYLLPCPDGWMLIDAGANTDDNWTDLTAAMSDAGVAPGQLRHIVVTHLHPDHCGLAARLRDASGATVWMHQADAEMLLHLTGSRRPQELLEEAMKQAGTPDSFRPAVLNSYDRLLRTFPALSPDAYLEDGAKLESWLGPLEVVWTPGHAPGLCCLHAAEFGYLFSSDHVIEDITPHVGWLPEPDGSVEDTLGQYLASLDRLDTLQVEKILPAHGAPFQGLQAWTARTREHHATRAGDIARFQSDGADVADDLIKLLWPRELRPMEYQLALTSVLAYLEHGRRAA